MDIDTTLAWIRAAAAAIDEHADELTRLDAAIGDADHGVNMRRGFSALLPVVDRMRFTTIGEVLLRAGTTLVSTVGGASGHRVVPEGEGPAEPVLVQRSGEGRALAVGAAHRAQDDHLLRQIHAVGDGLEPEVVGDAQQPPGDLVQPGGLHDALDEAPVQLQHVDGESAQRRDGRVAAAEAVQGDPDTEAPQLVQPALQLVERALQLGVGELDDQGAGGQPVTAQERLQRARGQ